MRHALIVAAGLVIAGPAAAQAPSLSNHAQLGPYLANSNPGIRAAVGAADAPVCMRVIRTSEAVCRTRDEWRQIAARISRGERWR